MNIIKESLLTEEEARKYKLSLRECILGDKRFYTHVAAVVIPIVVQNTLTNIVGLLDNVMVGQVGTIPMSAVAIVNQLFFVLYLAMWGATAGAGIYTTQFFGKGDYEGVRTTIRFKSIILSIIFFAAFIIFVFGGNALVELYISADTSAYDREQTLMYARQYMLIMIPGLIPFFFTNIVATTMREAGKTVLPMKASIAAMIINFILNALLIFGLFCFPKMGVAGAAVATSISRLAELMIIIIGALRKRKDYAFFAGTIKDFKLPFADAKAIFMKSVPLLFNEFFWALSQAVLLQCYSVRGIAVIAAMNICNTISQIFNDAYLSLGTSASIICGQQLGAGKLVEARRSAWRMAVISVTSCLVLGSILFIIAPVIPHLYNTEDEIRQMATVFIRVLALCMPFFAFSNAAYFIIRSGGRVFVTMLFDGVFAWGVSVPVAFVLANFTGLSAINIYACVCLAEFAKSIAGFILVKSSIWVKNLVRGET